MAPELEKKTDEDNVILGATDDDLKILPQRIPMTNVNCNIEIQLTNDLLLRVNTVETAVEVVKKIVSVNHSPKTTKLSMKRTPTNLMKTKSKAKEHQTENRSSPYSLRARR